jgi:hypothetical protein
LKCFAFRILGFLFLVFGIGKEERAGKRRKGREGREEREEPSCV